MGTPQRWSSRSRPLVTRVALASIGAVGLSMATEGPVGAQVAVEPKPGWEIVVPAGTIIPTGSQRDALARGGVTALQVSYVPRPALAVVATLGWARSRNVAEPNHPKLDVFLFDVGTELRAPRWITYRALTLNPFAGVGVGARAYNHRAVDVLTQHAATYGAAGAELGFRRIRLRFEARDYLSGFDSIRNDVVVMLGLRIASRL